MWIEQVKIEEWSRNCWHETWCNNRVMMRRLGPLIQYRIWRDGLALTGNGGLLELLTLHWHLLHSSSLPCYHWVTAECRVLRPATDWGLRVRAWASIRAWRVLVLGRGGGSQRAETTWPVGSRGGHWGQSLGETEKQKQQWWVNTRHWLSQDFCVWC